MCTYRPAGYNLLAEEVLSNDKFCGQRHSINVMQGIAVVLTLAAAIGDARSPQLILLTTNHIPNRMPNKMSDPKAECEDVLNAVMPFAEEVLTKHREFFPFGGTMSTDGEIAHTGGWTGDEHPASAEVIRVTRKGIPCRRCTRRIQGDSSGVRISVLFRLASKTNKMQSRSPWIIATTTLWS